MSAPLCISSREEDRDEGTILQTFGKRKGHSGAGSGLSIDDRAAEKTSVSCCILA
jgi:hypothetical protein